jgi:hypothetical protein
MAKIYVCPINKIRCPNVKFVLFEDKNGVKNGVHFCTNKLSVVEAMIFTDVCDGPKLITTMG